MKQKLRVLIACLLVVLFGSGCMQQEPLPKIWGSLQKGSYGVGFQAMFLEDTSRSFFKQDTLNIEGRPIRVLMWFPTDAQKQNMVIEDYVNVSVDDTTYRDFNAIFNQIEYGKMARLQSPKKEVADSLLPLVLNENVAGQLNANPAEGSFPLILHSLGRNGSQLESFVLWEYLASNGFTVAVIPQLGSRPGKFNSISWTKEDLAVQKEDLEFTLSKLKGMDFVDSTRVGFMGYSSGGVIGYWLAAERNDIDVQVMFDGAQTTKDGIQMLDTLGVAPEDINIPLLNLYNAENHLLDLSFIDGLEDKHLYNVKMNQVTHFDFNQWPLYFNLTDIPDERGTQWRKPEDAAESYLLMCRLVETFFSSHFYDQNTNKNSVSKKLNTILENTKLAEAGF